MTSQFLNFYIENLEVLSVEMNRNQQLIRLLNNNINALALDVQEKLKQLFGELIKKERLDQAHVEKNSKIKLIYLLMRQIQKSDADKRSLTRKSCDILDNYLVSLDEKWKDLAANRHNGDDNNDLCAVLINNQSVGGNALIVDLIKKMENARTKSGPNPIALDDVNKNVEVSTQNFQGIMFQDMPSGEVKLKSSVSDLIHRLDNLQVFTDKIFDICMEMKSRHKIEEPSDQDVSMNSHTSDSSTEENAELCHCRTQEIGEMVACDNTKCKTKWYHFECVGLYNNPKGLWYCPSCIIFENVTK